MHHGLVDYFLTAALPDGSEMALNRKTFDQKRLKISSNKIETFSGTSSTITIQNGPDAGQTVPHVHD